MQDYRKLEVWRRAHQLTLQVYNCSASFPREEVYSLTSQIRRAASSIPANIVEGCGRESNADFARFLQIAVGSAHELEYHLLLAKDLTYLTTEDYSRVAGETAEVKKMLSGLLGRVRSVGYPPSKKSNRS